MHNKAPEFHIPVLGPDVSNNLVTDVDGIYVDATLGGGGHAEYVLRLLSKTGRVIGLDRDPDAVQMASQRLTNFGDQVSVHQAPFWQLGDVLTGLGIDQIAGILFDLGLSSHQIDDPERGFSFQQDGPLNMRMGPDATQSASEVVNTYSQHDLTRIFRSYGEERASPAIARAICRAREEEPILQTKQLANLIRGVVRGAYIQKTLARIFQAIRIEVNRELIHLEATFQTAIDVLQPGGRIAILSYHSLEHRMVKQVFQAGSRECINPLRLPICPCQRQVMIWEQKPIRPNQDEITANPRARSATLRIAERLDVPKQPWVCLQGNPL